MNVDLARDAGHKLIGQLITVEYHDGRQTGEIFQVQDSESGRTILYRTKEGGPALRADPEKHDIRVRGGFDRDLEEVPYR